MFEEILFPTDGSDGASWALEHALDIATTHGATLHLLNVADTTRESLTQIQGQVVDTLESEGNKVVNEAADQAEERDIPVIANVLQGEPHSTIVDYAADREVDLIVMPTHGRRGLTRLLLGSTTERVVRTSPVPVLTVRPDAETEPVYPYRDVLVPTDGSECARAALDLGIDLAGEEETALHLLSVVDSTTLGVDVRAELQVEYLEQHARNILADAASVAADAGVDPADTTIEFGTPIYRGILEYAETHDVDVIVAGTHGRSGLDRYLLGSVTEKLVRTAPVPVLTVREGDTVPDTDE